MEILEFLLNDDQIFTTITLVVLIALFIGNVVADKLKKYEDVDPNGVISLMDEKDLIILDVREKKELKSGYIKGSKHIPLSDVKNQLDSLDNSQKILVYCRSGSRSSHIAGLLTRNNFEQVHNLKGGMLAWQKANLPIKK
ncbi:MAG: rhodanese-like domain-containing protein [Gammaproteobacteria bacterium]|nr:rhodanese-like domain-containing protein [Gammaproteobacteria bacterium]